MAIALPGLPTYERAAEAVQQYLQVRPDVCDADGDAWARRVMLAKLWSTVEFLAMAGRGARSVDAAPGVAFLRESLLGWYEAEVSYIGGRAWHAGRNIAGA